MTASPFPTIKARWGQELGDPLRVVDISDASFTVLEKKLIQTSGSFSNFFSDPSNSPLLLTNYVFRLFLLEFEPRRARALQAPHGFDFRKTFEFRTGSNNILFLMRLIRYPPTLMNWLGILNTILPGSITEDTWRIDYVVLGYSSDPTSTKETLFTLAARACSDPNLVRED